MKIVDGRKLACPKPVLLTKEAISNEANNQVEVIVDNKAALENVKRFLTSFGFEVEKVATHTINNNSEFRILAKRVKSTQEKKDSEFDVNDYPCPIPTPSSKGKTIFFKSEYLGIGDDKLGALLMKAFIYTLNEVDNQPARLLFMNSGVKLCIEGAITLENLQKLEEKGVDILVCGTCLDFFGISEKLKVGKISNMYDIAGGLTDNSSVLTV
ncbi:sulfurtransferase-like selenium metabolism protein YedF [bacterium]|nr:sulfurtransferase-like selenium metabolism protein YedF [bacterium]